jgi:hypothetical protein
MDLFVWMLMPYVNIEGRVRHVCFSFFKNLQAESANPNILTTLLGLMATGTFFAGRHWFFYSFVFVFFRRLLALC